MVLQPRDDASPLDATDDPLPEALAEILQRRGLSVSALGSLLRAEGVEISRSRLHQLCSGAGAPASFDQIERLSSVVGVSPSYFAEYRLWRIRALIDPGVVGLDRALENAARLVGRRRLSEAGDGVPRPRASARYPGPRRRASEERG